MLQVGIAEADTHAALLPEDKQRRILAHTWPEGQPAGAAAAKPRSDLEARMLPKLSRGPLEVGFVGDGLNDCPALASAHVGIVLQEVGSQATVDASSAVLQVVDAPQAHAYVHEPLYRAAPRVPHIISPYLPPVLCERGARSQLDIDQLPAAIIIARRSRQLVLTNLFLALGINIAVIALAASVGLPLWVSVLSDSGGLLVVLANSLWPLMWRVGTAIEPSAPAMAPPLARPNVRALTGTLMLSTMWTVAQLMGARIANSSSLMSDALAMLVDDGALLPPSHPYPEGGLCRLLASSSPPYLSSLTPCAPLAPRPSPLLTPASSQRPTPSISRPSCSTSSSARSSWRRPWSPPPSCSSSPRAPSPTPSRGSGVAPSVSRQP